MTLDDLSYGFGNPTTAAKGRWKSALGGSYELQILNYMANGSTGADNDLRAWCVAGAGVPYSSSYINGADTYNRGTPGDANSPCCVNGTNGCTATDDNFQDIYAVGAVIYGYAATSVTTLGLDWDLDGETDSVHGYWDDYIDEDGDGEPASTDTDDFDSNVQ